MKKTVLILSCCLVCLFSCEKGNIADCPSPSLVGLLLDGGPISDISLYCLENKMPVGQQELWYDYYAKTKTVPDYGSFYLRLMLNRNGYNYTNSDYNVMSIISDMEHECERKKSSFIVEKYNDYVQKDMTEWPTLFTAYLNGEVIITCDKVLFGEQPGTNLSSFFSVFAESRCIPIGIENPKILYGFGEEIPTKVPEFFVKETWLQPKYDLRFSEQPTEKYEELTLYITLPLMREHIRNIVVSEYKGLNLTKVSESVLKSECLIKFNWE